jgi:hemerythrin-like metal-binding protein
MALFTWNPAYSISVPQIDAEHQRLFVLSDQLHGAMKAGSSRAVVESTLAGLIGYCRDHFRHEETVMRESGYPELRAHQALHGWVYRLESGGRPPQPASGVPAIVFG